MQEGRLRARGVNLKWTAAQEHPGLEAVIDKLLLLHTDPIHPHMLTFMWTKRNTVRNMQEATI